MTADFVQQRKLYDKCICQQLWEVDMLTSIYCAPGDMHVFDPGVISDFNEFLSDPSADPATMLKAHLDYMITVAVTMSNGKQSKLDVRMELPHLYPLLEGARVVIHSSLLNREKEVDFRKDLDNYISTLVGSDDGYVFQIISWIQDHIDQVLETSDGPTTSTPNEELVNFQRLWIYSHHLKSKTKRQEIVRQARTLSLTGFSRPGKPGIICVEGAQGDAEEFWRIIKAMHWQKISICKTEQALRKSRDKMEKMRRFEGFREQLFCDANTADNEDDEASGPMDMATFIKYLEAHKSGYMKKELFGLE